MYNCLKNNTSKPFYLTWFTSKSPSLEVNQVFQISINFNVLQIIILRIFCSKIASARKLNLIAKFHWVKINYYIVHVW